jgi:hypothetical protein
MIIQATNNQTPDATQGGSAVTGNNNTSHGATNSNCVAGSEDSCGVSKTCRWLSFPARPVSKITVQFSWSITGTLTLTGAAPGTTTADALYRVQYSVDGGSNWTTVLTRSFSRTVSGSTPISDSGSVSQNIVGLNSGLVQLRDLIQVSASSVGDPTVSESADLTATISGIQLDITPVDSRPIVIIG